MHAIIALIAESRALPELQVVRDRAHRSIREGCSRIVTTLAPALGDEECEDRAQRLHALLDGLALHLIHLPDGTGAHAALRILRDELESLDQ